MASVEAVQLAEKMWEHFLWTVTDAEVKAVTAEISARIPARLVTMKLENGLVDANKKGLGMKYLLLAAFAFMSSSSLAGCPSANTPEVPCEFVASIGGWGGTSYRVELRNEIVVYTTASDFGVRTAEIKPSAEQWTAFRNELDAVDIWRWRADYTAAGVSDGTRWSVSIQYVDKNIQSKGRNLFPDNEAKPNWQHSASFGRYLSAVSKLINGAGFSG